MSGSRYFTVGQSSRPPRNGGNTCVLPKGIFEYVKTERALIEAVSRISHLSVSILLTFSLRPDSV